MYIGLYNLFTIEEGEKDIFGLYNLGPIKLTEETSLS